MTDRDQSQTTSRPMRGGEWLWLGGAMLLATLLTLPYLGARGYWFDEAFSVTAAGTSWAGLYHLFVAYENNMGLYYALLHGWMAMLGSGEASVRLLSLLAALATLPVVHAIARRLFGVREAMLTDALLAVNTLFLINAQDARSYSLLLLCSSLTVLCFITALERPRALTWALFAVAGAASVYAHYFGLLTVAACYAATLWGLGRPQPWRWLIGTGLGMALLLVPLAVIRPPDASQVDWIRPPGLRMIGFFLSTFACNSRALVAAGLACVLASAWRYRTALRAGGSPAAWPWVLCATWFLLPVGTALAVSWLIKPVFMPKYLIGSLPAVLMLIAAGLASLPRPAMVAGLLLMTVPITIADARTGSLHQPSEDWPGLVRQMIAQARRGDGVLCYPYHLRLPLRLYLDRLPSAAPHPVPCEVASAPYHPGGGSRMPPPDPDAVQRVLAEHGRLWLVTYTSAIRASDANQDALRTELLRHYYFSEHLQATGLEATLFFDPMR